MALGMTKQTGNKTNLILSVFLYLNQIYSASNGSAVSKAHQGSWHTLKNEHSEAIRWL